MSGNTFGHLFRLTTFGESHGKAIGGVIDGCPAAMVVDLEIIQNDINRRRPVSSVINTPRNEEDLVEMLSGIYKGKTTGAPIAFVVKNKDARSEDYNSLEGVYRPSHADFTYEKKYGWRDHRGGGRSSARETLARVVAGSIAKQYLNNIGIHILAFVDQIGPIKLEKSEINPEINAIERSPVRCPDEVVSNKMIEYIEKLKKTNDTSGGAISCIITGVPAGLGEPVFDKIHAELGKSMLSINAVKGFEIGSGFRSAHMKGSEHNDEIVNTEGNITTLTNNSGGVQGGITNGEIINFRLAFKPVASISIPQNTVNKQGDPVKLNIEGRHDVCVVTRAVPIVEAMAAIVVMDHYLRNKVYQNK